MIRFDGCKLPRRQFELNQYWHDSILSKRKQVLADYAHSFDSVAALMGTISQAIFKVKNLHEILSGEDGMEILLKRLELLEMSMSVVNAMMIADEENFERKSTDLSGIPDILRKFEERLVAQSEYPHTILLGEAPGSGLGEQGKSELRDYYDSVARRQETQLKPALKMFLKAVFNDKNGPTKGKEPESWDIKFNPLWQESNLETLDQREKQARTDQIYISSGVLAAEEIAQSRFGSGEYSFDTTLIYKRGIEDSDDGDVSSDTQENTDETKEIKPLIDQVLTPVPQTPSTTDVVTEAQVHKVTSAQESLNGAQVASLLDILGRVAEKTLPRESAINIIKIAFALSEENAESMMGPVGKTFQLPKPEPVQPTPIA